jgi:Icc protein
MSNRHEPSSKDGIDFTNQQETSSEDGIDRRGFLKCMAWAGTGVLWTVTGGILSSCTFAEAANGERAVAQGALHFAQISDSHIGFNKPANPNVTSTMQAAIEKINALPVVPSFLIHTGDITHLAAADQFDTSDQVLKSAKAGEVFYVPGEHDVSGDDGKLYRQRYGKNSMGAGWYSFDHQGVHFIGLVNVMNLKAGGLGNLGQEQLTWLEKDLKGKKTSTPIVVFAHMPLWMIYPEWGWGTADGAQALSFLKRFGSVTVLNGHIHQTMQKVEGDITFHTATSTAFPQPAPGKAAGPGPMKVPAEKLHEVLGITTVNYVKGHHSLAIVDSSLG